MKDLHAEILEKIKMYKKYIKLNCEPTPSGITMKPIYGINPEDFYDLATDILKIVKDRENEKHAK